MHWYPADYLADTIGLPEEADLIYRRMLDACWISCGLPVDKKAIAQTIRIHLRKFRRNYDVYLSKLWIEIDGKLWSPRLHREYLQTIEKSAKARQSAAARWHQETMRTHSYPQCERNANHNQSNNISNYSANQREFAQGMPEEENQPPDRLQRRLDAWSRMETLLRNHSLFQQTVTADPVMKIAIRDLGGWPRLKALKANELPGFKGKFMSAYSNAQKQPQT